MRPNVILFLCAFGLSLQGLLPWMQHQNKPVPLLSLLFVVLAFGVLRKFKGAFRTFQAIIWIVFILTLVAALTILFSEKSQFAFLDDMMIANSTFNKLLYFTVWMIALGAVLYYMESPKVRLVFGLPPKGMKKSE